MTTALIDPKRSNEMEVSFQRFTTFQYVRFDSVRRSIAFFHHVENESTGTFLDHFRMFGVYL